LNCIVQYPGQAVGLRMRNEWRRAAIDGNTAAFERLLEKGQAVDSRDRFGQTPLMLAAVHRRKAVVDLLLAHDADLDVTAKYGLSALMLAIVNGHTGIALALIEAGADTTLQGTGAPGFAGRTASDLAQERGFASVVEAIARRGPTDDRSSRRG
jgi:ankyrin repeat protein